MTAFTSSAFSIEPPNPHQLRRELQEAGFQQCRQLLPGFVGTLYVCELPIGYTYVLLPPHPSGLIEAFVGDWLMPQRYFQGAATGVQQLLRLLS